jgi:hypothetical protein
MKTEARPARFELTTNGLEGNNSSSLDEASNTSPSNAPEVAKSGSKIVREACFATSTCTEAGVMAFRHRLLVKHFIYRWSRPRRRPCRCWQCVR